MPYAYRWNPVPARRTQGSRITRPAGERCAGRADHGRLRPADRAVRAVGHVGRTRRAQQQQPETDDLQDRGDVGQSRRIDAAVADDPVAVRRVDRDFREKAARGYAGRDARGAGGAQPWFFRVPALFVEPVQTAAGGAARRAGIEPAVAGHRFGLPSADALRRLCRVVGRIQLCRRRADHA